MEKNTKRKGWLIFLTTISIVSLLAAFAYAQGPWGAPQGQAWGQAPAPQWGQQQGQGWRGSQMGQRGQFQGKNRNGPHMLFRGLDLTDEQKEDLEALRDKHQDAVKEIRDKVRDAREELRDLMDDPIDNKSDILKKIDEVSELQVEQKSLMAEHIYDAAEILDAEQLEKFQKRIKFALVNAVQQRAKGNNFKSQHQGRGQGQGFAPGYGQGYGQGRNQGYGPGYGQGYAPQAAPNQYYQRGPQGPAVWGGGF
jgi:protein CpxP